MIWMIPGFVFGILITYGYLRWKIGVPLKCFYRQPKKSIKFEQEYLRKIIGEDI